MRRIVCNVAHWPSPTSSARTTRRRWFVALALGALGVAGATAVAGDGLLRFRDPGPSELTFPNEITCHGATLCTPGRSPDGQAFRLFTIGTSGQYVHIVGAGVDTGDGTQVTPLVCIRPGSDLQCGGQPPEGETRLGMYVPG